MEHDALAKILIILAQAVIDNADTLAGKLIGLGPFIATGAAGLAHVLSRRSLKQQAETTPDKGQKSE